MREKSDKSKSAWHSRKYVRTELNFFHTQFLHLLWVFCQDLELQAALTGRKKPVLGQKKAANNFFDADHHFETHKIGFKNFDQQWDVPKRGVEPVKLKKRCENLSCVQQN